MAPQVTNWDDLMLISEEFETETNEFRYTMFAAVDGDVIYFGQLNIPKRDLSFQQITSALSPIPDDQIFPQWPPSDMKATQAPEVLPANIYIKRPNLSMFDVFKEYNVLHLLPQGLKEEVEAMEAICQHPHPNIIRYHGCQVRRGRITGLVLDRHPIGLRDYLKHEIGTINKELFMETLESAIHHLHSLGWAHNDLNPDNILINKAGMPILIDFGSAREIGQELSTSRGTRGWIDGEMMDYTKSEKRHDISALDKIRAWLDKPTFID
ncbi:MAG: hypothetical protein M1819_004718 [Sarea resinae]|nr:MAG: hypothetical protein M1819_004718 [Sarea resinae]